MPFAPILLHKPVSAGFCKYFAVWLWKSLESNMYIEGKMAIITGSTSGIGSFGGEISGNDINLRFFPDSEF